ncbi:MAG: TetR/AcrR family transcriptional regulator [bacterium]|nr:TetR/AcrR family transcriptional regulator [bacterium]
MGTLERKQRLRKELRSDILAAAESMFVADGYENVSMRKIADRIEYSPTTIYRIFKNKAEIMNCLITSGYRGVEDMYRQILAVPFDSPLDALNRIIRTYIDYCLEQPRHFELWLASGKIEVIDGKLHMRHGETLFQVYETWLMLIRECQSAGLFDEMETHAVFELLWTTVIGTISLRIHQPGFPWTPLEDHIDGVTRLLNRGPRVG